MRAAVVCALVVAAVCGLAVNAQLIPWSSWMSFGGKAQARGTELPPCSGSVLTNCWEQTSGAPDVTITGYRVSSSVFPCTEGVSATTFDFDTKVAIADGECPTTCSGFGCNGGTYHLCKDFGFPQCPMPAGVFSTTGNSASCQSGFGDYEITINCPQFTLVTRITY